MDGMKNAPTEISYLQAKGKLEQMIQTVVNVEDQNSLKRFLKFWEERKCRWVQAFRRQSNCGIPRNSLAESAHAKMKAGGRKNLSLVDAAHADIEACVMFEAKWQQRMDGERSTGTGPTGMMSL